MSRVLRALSPPPSRPDANPGDLQEGGAKRVGSKCLPRDTAVTVRLLTTRKVEREGEQTRDRDQE